MLDGYTRWARFFRVKLKKSDKDAPGPTPDLDDVITDLQIRAAQGRSVRVFKKGTAATRIQEVEVDDDQVTLLLNYADQNASDPTFTRLSTGSLRVEPKLDGEGVSVSAHLAIWRAPVGHHEHIAVLERVPGITPTYLKPLLNRELKEVARYTYTTIEGREKSYWPVIQFDPMPSQELKAALESGVLEGVELVADKFKSGDFDEEGTFEERRRLVQLRPTGELRGSDAMQALDGLIYRLRSNKSEYKKLKVRYKAESGKSQTEEIPLAAAEPGGRLVTRWVLMKDFDPELPQTSSEIRADMSNRMRGLLMAEVDRLSGAGDD